MNGFTATKTTPSGSVVEYRRGSLRVFRLTIEGRQGGWIASAPGMSASGDTPQAALDLLTRRVQRAAKALGLTK